MNRLPRACFVLAVSLGLLKECCEAVHSESAGDLALDELISENATKQLYIKSDNSTVHSSEDFETEKDLVDETEEINDVFVHIPEAAILNDPPWHKDKSSKRGFTLRPLTTADVQNRMCPRLSPAVIYEASSSSDISAAEQQEINDTAHNAIPCFKRKNNEDLNVDGGDIDHSAFRGRYLEDVVAVELFFSNLTDGVMVEVGANDGVIFSSSFVFDKALKWKTILIEGNPVLANAAVSKRPEALILNLVVCHDFGLVHFSPMGTQGGIVELLPKSVAAYFHPHIFNDPTQPEGRSPAHDVPAGEDANCISPSKVHHNRVPIVECLPLDFVLNELGVTHIDFMTIDLVGAELAVLSSFDFDELQVRVVAVNLDPERHQAKRRNAVRQYMRHHGYAEFQPDVGWLLLPLSRSPRTYDMKDDRLRPLLWFVKPELLMQPVR